MKLHRSAFAVFVTISAAAQVAPVTLTTPTTPEIAPDGQGFIPRRLLLEPIPVNGLTESAVRKKTDYFSNQYTVLPHDADPVSVGKTELTWRAVNCPRETADVRLAIGSSAVSVWWVHGKELIGIDGDRQTVTDDGASKRLTLHQGPNIVRAAIINDGGATGFYTRFLDADDKPLKDYTVTLSAAGAAAGLRQ